MRRLHQDLFESGARTGTLAGVAGDECRVPRVIARLVAIGATTAVLVVAPVALATATTADASPSVPTQSQISAEQRQIQQIESTIAQQQAEGDQLSQKYDAAEQQLATTQAALATTQASIATTRTELVADKRRLHIAALDAYVHAVPDNRLNELFTAPAGQAVAAQVYQNLAVGHLTSAADALATDQARLAAQESQQVADQQQASGSAALAQSLAATNATQTKAAQATLTQAQGTLSQQIAAYAAQQAQQAQLAAARAAAAKNAAAAAKAANAAAAAASVAGAVGGGANSAANQAAAQAAASAGVTISGSTNGSATGRAAVNAALTQLGVPYVFGGTRSTDTPPPGFDCSGLTQWAWQQAGVSIQRTSELQWASLTHVSLTALEPGDLIFSEGAPPGHVVMYVGSGPYGSETVVEAPHTGTDVMYTSALLLGTVTGAARP